VSTSEPRAEGWRSPSESANRRGEQKYTSGEDVARVALAGGDVDSREGGVRLVLTLKIWSPSEFA